MASIYEYRFTDRPGWLTLVEFYKTLTPEQIKQVKTENNTNAFTRRAHIRRVKLKKVNKNGNFY